METKTTTKMLYRVECPFCGKVLDLHPQGGGADQAHECDWRGFSCTHLSVHGRGAKVTVYPSGVHYGCGPYTRKAKILGRVEETTTVTKKVVK